MLKGLMILILSPPNSGSSTIFQLCSQGSVLPIPVGQNPWNVKIDHIQRAKKVVSDSPGLVDFAIGLVNSVFNLPDGQGMFFEEFE